ncbi:MAG: hotdog domain-containing protein [Rhodospirillales bacterium]|nr:hotdog domain-containing protein [Rhodospirillales bacterium]|tara:strand:- start:285 stop:692 length:408 start_codon:yes stop_codon:yes gene_type:complete
MKDSLVAGISTTAKILVDRDRTIGFMGDEGRVYATPWMVRDIEHTARDWLIEHLDEDEDTVGTHVSVDHIAATVEGDSVEVTITVEEVNGRAVSMSAHVKDSLEDVGIGKHNRFVVDKSKTFERLETKRAKIEAL